MHGANPQKDDLPEPLPGGCPEQSSRLRDYLYYGMISLRCQGRAVPEGSPPGLRAVSLSDPKAPSLPPRPTEPGAPRRDRAGAGAWGLRSGSAAPQA